jgi:uncharacterized cofD-like protein
VDIEARFGEEKVRGQVEIKSAGLPITDLTLIPPEARALPEAVEAICGADLITIGPGSLFTSLIPNLLVKGIAEALACSRALKIYICNAMTEADETDGYQQTSQQLTGMDRDLPSTILSSTQRRSLPRCKRYVERAGCLSPRRRASRSRKICRLPQPQRRLVRHDPAS